MLVQIVGQIIPKCIVVIPGTDGMQLLLFHDSAYIVHCTLVLIIIIIIIIIPLGNITKESLKNYFKNNNNKLYMF